MIRSWFFFEIDIGTAEPLTEPVEQGQ